MQGQPEGPTQGQPDRAPGEETAWQLLSSPRVLLGLLVVLGLLLAWAQTVPQGVPAAEIAPLAPYAEAETLTAFGLHDALVSWPVLLVGLLAALVATGLLLGQLRRGPNGGMTGALLARQTTTTPEPLDAVRQRLPAALGTQRLGVRILPDALIARAGLATEAGMVLVVGLVALVAAAFIGRANGLEARLELVPGQLSEAADVRVKDGDILLPRALGLDLRCPRPDPMDPTRTQTCTLVTGQATASSALGAPPTESVVLRPGLVTDAPQGLTLTPRSAALRIPAADEPLEVLVRRTADAPPERLVLTPRQPIELTATGHRLQAFVGQDGPLVLVTHPTEPPRLLGPPTSAAPSRATVGPLLEVVPPTRQVVTARTHPESTLTILGVLMLAAGLLGLGLVPSAVVTLTTVPGGTRVEVRGSHPTRVERAARALAPVAVAASGTPS